MPSVEFSRESLSRCWEDLQPLAQLHWTETGKVIKGFSAVTAVPNKEAYFAMDAAGFYRAYVARSEGRAVGYSTFTVAPSLQHGLLVAMHDVLFIQPEFRRGRIAYDLLKFGDVDLRAGGVEIIVQESPLTNDIGTLFRRLGYVPVGVTYVRVF